MNTKTNAGDPETDKLYETSLKLFAGAGIAWANFLIESGIKNHTDQVAVMSTWASFLQINIAEQMDKESCIAICDENLKLWYSVRKKYAGEH